MGWKDLEKRLTTRFGLGENPLITKRLYRRLQREVNTHGEEVMKIISECVESSSVAKFNAGAWFRAAVSKRLKENGFLLAPAAERVREEVCSVKRRVLAAIGGGEPRGAPGGDRKGDTDEW